MLSRFKNVRFANSRFFSNIKVITHPLFAPKTDPEQLSKLLKELARRQAKEEETQTDEDSVNFQALKSEEDELVDETQDKDLEDIENIMWSAKNRIKFR